MKYYVYGPGKDQSKSGVINGEITPDRHIWFRKRNDKGKIDQFTGKLTQDYKSRSPWVCISGETNTANNEKRRFNYTLNAQLYQNIDEKMVSFFK